MAERPRHGAQAGGLPPCHRPAELRGSSPRSVARAPVLPLGLASPGATLIPPVETFLPKSEPFSRAGIDLPLVGWATLPNFHAHPWDHGDKSKI